MYGRAGDTVALTTGVQRLQVFHLFTWLSHRDASLAEVGRTNDGYGLSFVAPRLDRVIASAKFYGRCSITVDLITLLC